MTQASRHGSRTQMCGFRWVCRLAGPDECSTPMEWFYSRYPGGQCFPTEICTCVADGTMWSHLDSLHLGWLYVAMSRSLQFCHVFHSSGCHCGSAVTVLLAPCLLASTGMLESYHAPQLCNRAICFGCDTIVDEGFLCCSDSCADFSAHLVCHAGCLPSACNRAIRLGCVICRFCSYVAERRAMPAHFFLPRAVRCSTCNSPVPNKHIGGSGVLTVAVHVVDNHCAGGPIPACFESLLYVALHYVLPGFWSLAICGFFALLRLLFIGAKAPKSSLGRIVGVFCPAVFTCMLRGLRLSPHDTPTLKWQPGVCKPRPRVRCRVATPKPGFGPWFLLQCLIFGNLPICVWSAPKGLGALQYAHDCVANARQTPDLPESLPVPSGVPGPVVPDYIDAGLSPLGPPPPVPRHIAIDNAVQHTQPAPTTFVNFPVWVGTAGYEPETMQLQLGVPCDVEDAIDAVERYLTPQRAVL